MERPPTPDFSMLLVQGSEPHLQYMIDPPRRGIVTWRTHGGDTVTLELDVGPLPAHALRPPDRPRVAEVGRLGTTRGRAVGQMTAALAAALEVGDDRGAQAATIDSR